MKTDDTPNGTKDEIKAGILHSVGRYYVSNEGTKSKPSYHVWVQDVTHAAFDSAFSGISLAVARCNYLAKTKTIMETLELTKRALKITIWQDNDNENPLDWNDSIKVVHSSSRYILGNEKVPDLAEHIMDLLGYGEEYRSRMYDKYGDTKDLFDVLLERLNKNGYVALPVYAYIHSGVTVKTTPFGCRWDSGMSGFIYTKRTDYIKDFGAKKNVKNSVIEDHLKGNLKTFDTWLRGEVYYFSIEDAETGEILDSCGGFYGSDYAEWMVDCINYEEYGYTKEEMIQLIEDTEVTY